MTKPRGRPPLPDNMETITINLTDTHVAAFFALGKAGGSPDIGALTAGVRQAAEMVINKNTVPTENTQ